MLSIWWFCHWPIQWKEHIIIKFTSLFPTQSAEDYDIEWDPISSCLNSQESSELLAMYGDETHRLEPTPTNLPHVRINGHLINYRGFDKSLICSKYCGEKPPACPAEVPKWIKTWYNLQKYIFLIPVKCKNKIKKSRWRRQFRWDKDYSEKTELDHWWLKPPYDFLLTRIYQDVIGGLTRECKRLWTWNLKAMNSKNALKRQ